VQFTVENCTAPHPLAVLPDKNRQRNVTSKARGRGSATEKISAWFN